VRWLAKTGSLFLLLLERLFSPDGSCDFLVILGRICILIW
jgi:hypothetical protein